MNTSRFRAPLITATLITATALLAGCSGQAAEPKFSPTPTSTSPTEPTSSSTPEREDPKDFIRRFVAAGDEMQNTLVSSEYRSMFTKGCQNCISFADLIDKIADEGGSVDFEGTKVLWIRGSGQQFKYRIRSGSTDYTERHNSELIHLDGSEVTNAITLTRKGEEWAVAYFAQIAGTAS